MNTKVFYSKDFIRQCLVHLSLLLSVFAFSGFNPYIQITSQDSVRTELFESRIQIADSRLYPYSNSSSLNNNCNLLKDKPPFSLYALFNYNNVSAVSFTTALNKTLSYNFSTIRLLLIAPLPSLADGFSHSFIG